MELGTGLHVLNEHNTYKFKQGRDIYVFTVASSNAMYHCMYIHMACMHEDNRHFILGTKAT